MAINNEIQDAVVNLVTATGGVFSWCREVVLKWVVTLPAGTFGNGLETCFGYHSRRGESGR